MSIVATYRVQLHKDFGFDKAAEIADYLQELGISHFYSSPYLQAAPDSKHGYDVVDHHKVNAELGGSEAHDRFSKRLNACNLGQVLDIVPNHMAISGRLNRYWWDVLENGPASRYASFFDIDWQTREEKLRNKLLAPILGEHYGKALEKGDIKLARNAAEFTVRYLENELPCSPRSLPQFLAPVAKESGSEDLAFIVDCLRRLPTPWQLNDEEVAERHRDKRVIGLMLTRLFDSTPFIAEEVDNEIRRVNADPNRLDQLLEEQNYRLAYWETAKQELPYRRFFDVNTLVGLRMERPQVFSESHTLIFNWINSGVLDGVRVDHPDGLLDPKQYFERLRQQAPRVWILGEKILERGEVLPDSWPIDGTTGYDFLNQVGGLFVDSANEKAIDGIYQKFTSDSVDYAEVCREKKHLVLRDLLGSDVNRLTAALADIFVQHRSMRDYTRLEASRVIREFVACFSVYRTYVVPDRKEISAEDKQYINEAADLVIKNRPELDTGLIEFVRDLLLMRHRGELEDAFVMSFQQFTGPAMAKGVEDTVFYCYNRLTALNEVGGDPGRFGVSVKEFHDFNCAVQQHHPRTMLASSTHDTKRSEDVRARLALLSEIPDEWENTLTEWARKNAGLKIGEFPDGNTEYLIYQTMIGAWPIDRERIGQYLEKATREAKRKTSWTAPDEAFENALKHFLDGLYANTSFLHSLEVFVGKLVLPGRINSLAATLLKLTSPGIPDTYQGTEIWDLSLVDPDNRRPVDYDKRRTALAELNRLVPKDLMSRIDEGLPKLWTIRQALKVRREHSSSFDEKGNYRPLFATGGLSDCLVAYTRGENVLVIAPRLTMRIERDGWGDTVFTLPSGRWLNVLDGNTITGGERAVSQLFASFPTALFIKQSDAQV